MRLYSESAIFTSRPMDIQLKLAADVGYSTGVQPSRRKSRFFQVHTMTTGILSLPVLADGFRRFVQPITVSQLRHQFDGAEKLHRVRVWPAQWPQFSSTDENSDIFRCAVQQLRHLSSEQPGRQIFCRPGRHRRLCHVISHKSIASGHRNSTSYPVRPATCPHQWRQFYLKAY
jgi:hypothetical protein